MSTDLVALPAGFEQLEPFVADWALPTAADRSRKRETTSLAEMTTFYRAAQPRLQDALALLDAIPIDSFGHREDRLMKLLLGLAHVSLAVEVQGESEALGAKDRHHMRITRTPAS